MDLRVRIDSHVWNRKRIVTVLGRKAVTEEPTRFCVFHPVDPMSELVRVDEPAFVVHEICGPRIDLRKRKVSEQLSRNGIDPILRNDVAIKWPGRDYDVPGRIEHTSCRVIDDCRIRREVAIAFGCEWNAGQYSQCFALAQAFPIDHEEEPVFAIDDLRQHDRSANCEAILISLEWRNRFGRPVEVVLRIERGITQKLENGSV